MTVQINLVCRSFAIQVFRLHLVCPLVPILIICVRTSVRTHQTWWCPTWTFTKIDAWAPEMSHFNLKLSTNISSDVALCFLCLKDNQQILGLVEGVWELGHPFLFARDPGVSARLETVSRLISSLAIFVNFMALLLVKLDSLDVTVNNPQVHTVVYTELRIIQLTMVNRKVVRTKSRQWVYCA